MVPVAEAHKVAVFQLTALRHARRTRGIEQDEQAAGRDRSLRNNRTILNSRKARNILDEEHLALIFVHQRTQFFVGYQQLGSGILHHEV